MIIECRTQHGNLFPIIGILIFIIELNANTGNLEWEFISHYWYFNFHTGNLGISNGNLFHIVGILFSILGIICTKYPYLESGMGFYFPLLVFQFTYLKRMPILRILNGNLFHIIGILFSIRELFVLNLKWDFISHYWYFNSHI